MFYTPDIAQTLTLSEEESQHCVQVLRAQAGDLIDVTDGCGHLYHCRVTSPHRRHCEVEILSCDTPAPLHQGQVHIAIAPTKNMDRLEWMLEKCTEMGIDIFTPLLCEHSERKTLNPERLQRIMVAAAKQSLKTTFPDVRPLTPIADFIRWAAEQDADLFIAHCIDGYDASDTRFALQHVATPGRPAIVLIGPEGDFSPAELDQALAAGFRPVSLGAARLRTETAGLVACHTLILINS